MPPSIAATAREKVKNRGAALRNAGAAVDVSSVFAVIPDLHGGGCEA